MLQPRSQGTLSFPGKLLLNLATKGVKLKYSRKNPYLALVARTIAGASNMKNAVNIWPQLFKGWITLSTG